jgi:hypothetical protein
MNALIVIDSKMAQISARRHQVQLVLLYSSLSRIRPRKGFCYIYFGRRGLPETSFSASNRQASLIMYTA